MHPHLLKLLVNNKGKGYFKAEAANTDEATIYLYDVIVSDDWWGGITPLAFMKELAAITAPTIHLRINSPGGDVFAARAMQQAIREHSSRFIVHIDGLAASAATFLPMVADESIIGQGSMFMIHNAWTIALGDAKDFRKTADLLDKIDGSIAADYVAKTRQELQQIRGWMDAETFFLDQEAVDAGFIDKIAEATPKAKIDWDLSAYAHAPVANSPKPENQPQQADETIDNHTKNRPKLRQLRTAA